MKHILPRTLSLRLAALCALALTITGTLGLTATAFAATPACDLQCVITFGNARIAERQAALDKLSKEVTERQKAGHISSDQANVLQADVSTNKTGLSNLKATLDGESDATKARQDVKNIYVQFRIFAVVLPRDYRTLQLDVEMAIQHKLKDLESKIEKAIDGASAENKAKLNALYKDYVDQVADAESKIDAGQTQLAQLTVENFNANEAGFKAAMSKLHDDTRDASKDLHQAGKDLHAIRALLKDKNAAVTSTPTP